MISILTTERLIVRRFTSADTSAFHAYRDDPDVAHWQGWDAPFAFSEAERLVAEFATSAVFEPGTWTQFAIQLCDVPDLIGDIGVRMEAEELTAELGFTIAREHWGNGYGREALSAMVQLLLDDIALDRVVAFTHHENIASIASLHAAGLAPIAVDGDDLVYYRGRSGSPRPRLPQ